MVPEPLSEPGLSEALDDILENQLNGFYKEGNRKLKTGCKKHLKVFLIKKRKGSRNTPLLTPKP